MCNTDRKPIIAQAEHEHYFRRGIQHRCTRIVKALDEQTGNTRFYPASDTPASVDPSKLPHRPLNQAQQEHDVAEVDGPALTTVQKHGASQPGWDTDAITRTKGGNPTSRIPKKGGFLLKGTAGEIARLRSKRNRGEIVK